MLPGSMARHRPACALQPPSRPSGVDAQLGRRCSACPRSSRSPRPPGCARPACSAPRRRLPTLIEAASTKKRNSLVGRSGELDQVALARDRRAATTVVLRRRAARSRARAPSRSSPRGWAAAAAASSAERGERAALKRDRSRARRACSGASSTAARYCGWSTPTADRGAATQPLAHRRIELEAQEMHRRGLLVVLALEVLVGDGVHALAAARPAPRRAARCPSARRACAGARAASGYSISIVAFQLPPSGTSGL